MISHSLLQNPLLLTKPSCPSPSIVHPCIFWPRSALQFAFSSLFWPASVYTLQAVLSFPCPVQRTLWYE
ncbi:hypothetical protein JHK82_021240 [Glycine max]|uniref:Uncharacterized protein n=2 Tax=Glycine subgen. Soja TaxID=1462606 RepID=K7L6D9_SOYBN|nr:hypothetical protein JHK85_021693 [Glycine max]RZB96687.1 hypothetical protein D0Y65_020423 [Glycine soja]KAG5025339.1 hypothetical protein JHK86_021253 [Glycine max]KAG5136509.1 hypothetical protein JHK82_021240 [Glycine max]KAH1050981.1 hypothetical protein GYH30_021096 [Glycine max]